MRVTIADSYAQVNTNAGFLSDGTISSETNLVKVVTSNSNFGIRSSNASNRIRVTSSFILNNSTGFSLNLGGLIDSGQDNVLQGNTTPGAPSGTFGKS
jgi:hypothetical protein